MLFEETLSEFLKGCKRLVVVGVGNRMRGDDAAGCLAISRMRGKIKGDVVLMDCGEVPENFTGRMKGLQPSHILFIDAVHMGMNPGEFRFVDDDLLISRSLSTHKQSLKLLFTVLREGIPGVKIKLLGIQPKTVDFRRGISRPLDNGLRIMVKKLIELWGKIEVKTIEWKEDGVYLIDQTALPDEVKIVRCEEYERIAQAIEKMEVRGAPAIGVAAAMGVALAAKHGAITNREDLLRRLEDAYWRLRATRPTARNLFWALDRMRGLWSGPPCDPKDLVGRVVGEAIAIAEEDAEVCRAIGLNGSELIEDGDGVLTHCNAGALACVEHGTALGVIRSAVERGKDFLVYASETRPLFQGARLTAFELMNEGIPFRLITDSTVGCLMHKGLVNKVVVGADLITRHGDVVNKIGTYSIAVLARHHRIPFYVAAPLSTIDLLKKIEDVVIEERPPFEVTQIRGIKIAPEGTQAINPAFDITPRELVSGIITESGVAFPPYDLSFFFRQGDDRINRVVC